jgi:hypothetical protein
VQNLKRAPDELTPTELAIELENMIAGLPGQGYLIIGGLPPGSRLSHGYENGDGTWTLLFDDLAELKFLPGPIRGVVSLKAEVFTSGTDAKAQKRRRIPLILHTDDAVPDASREKRLTVVQERSAPAPTSIAEGNNADVHATEKIGTAGNAEQTADETTLAPREGAHSSELIERSGNIDEGLCSPSDSERPWSDELDQLVHEAFADLPVRAEAALAAAEQRRVEEIKELSAAIMKQHEVIATLKRENEELRDETAKQLTKAKHEWQREESERAQAAWDASMREKDELIRELDKQRSSVEQLTGMGAALKAEGEAKNSDFEKRLKEVAAEAERRLVRARAEWRSEVERCIKAAAIQINTAVETFSVPTPTRLS